MIVEITTFCLQYIIVSGSAKYCQFGRQTHWLIKKESALFWRLMYPFAMHHGGFCETHHLQKAFSHHSSEILSEYWCTALPHSSPLSPLQEGAYAYTPHQSISGCTQSPPSLLPKVLQQGSTMHIANVQFKYMFILPLPKGIEISWDWRGGGGGILLDQTKLRNVWSLTGISRGVGLSLLWGRHGYFLELHNVGNYAIKK